MFILDQVDLTFQALFFAGVLILIVWGIVFVALRKLVAKWQLGFASAPKRERVSRRIDHNLAAPAFRRARSK